VRERVDIAAWQDALLKDMRAEVEAAGGENLTSIFFGGGTPSLMPPAVVEALLDDAERLWGFAPDIEITLEANPSSVEAANFAGLAQAGVNRVSLGVQSLDDATLQWLGRLHGVEEALSALEAAQEHFNRVSFDLIYALPDQSPDDWRRQLEQALAFGTSHLSLYQLTIEPGTRFATDVRRGVFTPMDDDLASELFELTQELTGQAGLPAYEVSNHARIGEESRHNLTYWRYQDYVGIGPGAHGRRNGAAITRHKKPENFLNAVVQRGYGIAEHRSLSPSEQASEALLMGLRLREGIDLAELSKRTQIAQEHVLNGDAVERHMALGLIWQEGDRIGASASGMPVLNALIEALINDNLVLA